MRIKILAALSALAAALGMVAFASVASSAHQGEIVASALCNPTTGNYDVTYTLSWSNVPRGVHATLSSRTGAQDFAQGWTYDTWDDWISRGESTGDRGSLQWTEQVPGSTLGNGPWVYAYTKWSNGYLGSLGHDTRIENLGGDCKIPLPRDATATANSVPASCSAPGSVTFALGNASWENVTDVLDGSRRAFAQEGHLFSAGVSTIDVGYVIQPQKSGADCLAAAPPVIRKPTVPGSVKQQNGPDSSAGSVVLDTGPAHTATGAAKAGYPPALAVTGDQRGVAGLLLAGGLLLTGGTLLALGRRLRALAG